MKKILKLLVFVLVLAFLYFGFTTYSKLDLISGFSAKSVASGHFIDHRSKELIEKTDNDINMITLATNTINDAGKFATSTVYGLKERKAIYREGLGAILINDDFDVSKPYLLPKRTKLVNSLPFPYGNNEPKDSAFANINYSKLKKAIDDSFDKKGGKAKRTRAVVVLYKDKLIGEKYDTGFSKDSKILGWSMTKSIVSSAFGVLAKQRKIDIYKPAPIAEWQNDDRKIITINDLLHMNSGLEWEEDYTKICDATEMLFQAEDMGKVQMDKPAKYKPNSHWYYSSGTTNLLSRILRSQFKTQQEYLDFWYSAVIDKIGMNSMIVEQDMSGIFVGSSYAWATARDWSKFGLLYLHKGNWNGEQVLEENWVKYTATPTNTSNGGYGAQFWLNAGGKFPDAPRDMFYCNGYQGQMVAIIPSLDMVIVRMGVNEGGYYFDFNEFLKEVISSVKK
ncbi:serine hydrolase domain-containing protein [Flavobacterium collinsii]|uniref:Beta-lactamase class C and other penicillin binding proteins n=1 Tax=Flavobacterium collinsii TaxID=1114861 RepID=A0A9W4TET1_9FLAO|nr:serine hydrolase [Flavobacterium collinsii]CAI2766179.1 Beta-lactamase class C and other penicillin binding proteins [Flavobacterium collinsii]